MSEMIAEAYGRHIKIFDVVIPQSTAVGLSLLENGKSIMFSKKANTAVAAYGLIAQEMVQSNNFISSGNEVERSGGNQ